ncbi:unnamed protein product, partial [Discosporangium mesarthrocarpum]
WKKARADEIAGLEEAGMWVETVLPKGRRSIDTNWVFKRKVNKFGEVVRYKGCLVAKGFRQIEGVDFHDAFAP